MPIEVDSLIFILSSSPPRLIPCKVIEQIVSRKSSGTSTTHVIVTPSKKEYTLEDMKQPWFPSLEEAEEYLIGQAKQLVNQTIEKAKKDSSSFFSSEVVDRLPEETEFQPSSSEIEMPDNETTITLENGVKARVILPEVLK